MKLQEAERCRASVAVHVTTVLPSGKVVPGCDEHVTFTGACPPVAVGMVKFTSIGTLSGDDTVDDAGHDNVGAAGGGGGALGDPQATAPIRPHTTRTPRRSFTG